MFCQKLFRKVNNELTSKLIGFDVARQLTKTVNQI